MTQRKNDLHVEEVFGVNREIPANYVARSYVDSAFVENLARDKHIVIYGGSKQGKTSLRKHCLNDSDYILVQCSNRWGIQEINSAILKAAGFQVNSSNNKTVSGRQKISANFGVNIPNIVNISLGSEKEAATSDQRTYQPMDLDPEDVNDIISALQNISFNKYIVLEDFHYLPTEVQNDFAIALKAYHERSKYTFIVIGVWLEGDRLSTFNGDLLGRTVSIDADKWEVEDLKKVIAKGAELLNISFSQQFTDDLIRKSFNSVYIVQEACLAVCKDEGIYGRQAIMKSVGAQADAQLIVKGIVGKNSARYESFLSTFAMGFQQTDLEMYKWILYPVITSTPQELENGLRLPVITQKIKAHHPRGAELNQGNLTQALKFSASLQVSKNIKPIVLDYDQTNRILNVVDRQFLIWFDSADKTEMLECADFANANNLLTN